MGWFSRRREPKDNGQGPDESLGMLSSADAGALRELIRETLAENGWEPQMHGDHAVLSDGRVFGFDNLARRVRGATDRRDWPSVVRSHFAIVLAGTGGATNDVLPETIVVRLLDVTAGTPLAFDYAPEWQPGVIEVLVADYPDRVEFLSDGRVAAMAPLGPWFDRARWNLRRILDESDVRVERIAQGEHWFDCAHSSSVFLATAATMLPEILPRLRPDVDLDAGVIFAVPFRHQLAFRDCRDPNAVIDAVTLLPLFASNGYANGVGPVSPHTYLWRDGQVEQLTRIADGRLQVIPGPYLEGILTGGTPA